MFIWCRRPVKSTLWWKWFLGKLEKQFPRILQDRGKPASPLKSHATDATSQVGPLSLFILSKFFWLSVKIPFSNPLEVKKDTREALGLKSFSKSDNPLPKTSYVPYCFFDKVWLLPWFLWGTDLFCLQGAENFWTLPEYGEILFWGDKTMQVKERKPKESFISKYVSSGLRKRVGKRSRDSAGWNLQISQMQRIQAGFASICTLTLMLWLWLWLWFCKYLHFVWLWSCLLFRSRLMLAFATLSMEDHSINS